MTNRSKILLIVSVLWCSTTLAADPVMAQANLYNDCTIRIVVRNGDAINSGNEREAVRVWKSVVQACTRYLNQRPRDKEKLYIAYVTRGSAYESLKESDHAFADYARAIEINSNNGHAYFKRGQLNYLREQYAAAIEDLTVAINRRIGKANVFSKDARRTAFRLRGQAFFWTDQYEKAIKDLTVVIGLGEASGFDYYFRGLSYAQSSEHRKAIADLTKSLEFGDSDSVRADRYLQRALVYIRADQLESAIVDFTRSIQLNPGHVMGYYLRAGAYEGKGDRERAIADLKMILEVRPNLVEADRDNIQRQVERLGGKL